ncbi:ABC transporter permease subunit [Neofamilia massiliensis]|uniref:ABC transporter permease subunit n=1 Tax=Neofamilia massiliensis TaxID=1673724 RepID=UPI0006BB593A|nr:ABC transporter permease subunit [Neofamilia massiliensis]
MKNLMKNERRLFLNKRFFIALTFALVSVFFLNQREYINFYQSYYPNMQSVYKSYLIPLESAQVRYEVEIKAYKDKLQNSSEDEKEEIKEIISDLEKKEEKYKDLSGLVKPLSLNLKQVQDRDFIDKQFFVIDQYIEENFIEDIKSKGRDGYEEGFALYSELDWANRVQKRIWDQSHEDNIPYGEITASEAVSYLLDGSIKHYYIIAIGLILFLNYDIWSKEFSDNEGKMILTLAYKRKKVFASRFIVRLLFTLLALLLPILILFVYMSIRYRPGFGGTVSVSALLGQWKLSNGPLIASLENLDFLAVNKIVPIWKANLLILILFSMWSVLIFSLLSLLDLFFENGIVTILTGLVLVFVTVAAKKLSIFNIGTYPMQYNLLYGLEREGLYNYKALSHTYEAYLLVTIIGSIILYLLGSLVLRKKRV